MIISHQHKFIFIKTEKTAGTSIEIALSRFCGPDDVITPIISKDEAIRQQLGYRGPQHDRLPLRRYARSDFFRALRDRHPLAFYHHAPASFIKPRVDPVVWNSYFKFCFERNPWDKVISWYYWHYPQAPRPTLSDFIQSPKANTIKGFELYTIHSDIVVDQVYRFEALNDAMADLQQRLGLQEPIVLPRTKTTQRSDRSSYRELLTPEDRDKIARVYAREIAFFGYTW